MINFARSILSNVFTLLLSFALAFLIWLNAQQVDDPIRREFFTIPINLVGIPPNSSLLTPDRENVQIWVEGSTSVITQLTSDNFSATADLSQVPFGEEVPVEIDVLTNVSRVSIVWQSREEINVHLEQLVSRDIPVRLDIRGSVARGHSQDEPLVDPESITVVGTASQVERLDFARVTVFLNGERETVVSTPQPIFYDRQGRVASVSNLSLSTEQVRVTIPINETAGFAEKLITVEWVGEPAPGYRLLGVSVEPTSVLVRGLPTLLSALTRVVTEPIDITGLTESFRQQVALSLPEGVTLAEVEEIFVDIEIEPILTTNTYNRPVAIQGLGRELTARVEPQEVRVVLFGPLPILDTLSNEEVHATVDLFGLDVGLYSLAPEVTFPDRGIELRSVQPTFVTVNITRAVTLTNELTSTIPITDTSSLLLPVPGTEGQNRVAPGTADNTVVSAFHPSATPRLLPKRMIYEL